MSARCQPEVWFVHDAGSLYVITAEDAWRSRAVQRGLSEARIWVGDVGVWSDAARYKALPMVAGRASTITEATIHSAVLEQFGRKYRREWSTWGPRFKSGLADGSRVLLKYQVS